MVIQVLFVLTGLMLPDRVFRDHGGWLIAIWLVAVLWWMDRSSPSHYREVEAFLQRRRKK